MKSVLERQLEQLEYEIARIWEYLSDFTQRSVVLFTLSGLLAFLPSIINPSHEYIEHFLIWTFPFIVVAIFFFYLSSPRISSVATDFVTPAQGSQYELPILKAWVEAKTDIWRQNLSLYNKVLKYHTICTTCIYLYLISLITNIYIFEFIGQPGICASTILLYSLVALGIWMIYHNKLKSQKGKVYGQELLMK